MKFWFDNILVNSWLPEGESGGWSIRKTIIPGNRLDWLISGGDEYSDMLAPGTYTGLFRKLKDGTDQRVMFDEPREIKEALAFVNKAKGKILVTGLGLGMVAAWLANKKEVTQVDVIENSLDVISLVKPHLRSEKIRVIHADAFTFTPTQDYDSAWHDCFYIVPEQEKRLTERLPIKDQAVWTPGILTQPIARRSFLRGALIGIAGLVAAVKLPRKVAAAGITPVQETTGAGVFTFSSPTTAGNSIVLRIACATTITSVSGFTSGWVKDIAQLGLTSAGVGEVSIWHIHNINGGVFSGVITPSGRGSAFCMNAIEYSGLNNALAEAMNSNSNAGSSTVTTNNVTPISTNSLVAAVGAWAANDYASGPINSFARKTPTSTTAIFQENADQIENAAAAYSTGYGLTVGIAWAAAIAVFGGNAAGPTNAQRGAGFFMPNEEDFDMFNILQK